MSAPENLSPAEAEFPAFSGRIVRYSLAEATLSTNASRQINFALAMFLPLIWGIRAINDLITRWPQPSLSLSDFYPLAFSFGTGFLLLWYGWPSRVKRRLQATECALSMDEWGLKGQKGKYRFAESWGRFTSITEAAGHIIFWSNTMQIVRIPKSAFSSPEDARDFLGYARHLLQKAKSSAPPIAEAI